MDIFFNSYMVYSFFIGSHLVRVFVDFLREKMRFKSSGEGLTSENDSGIIYLYIINLDEVSLWNYNLSKKKCGFLRRRCTARRLNI